MDMRIEKFSLANVVTLVGCGLSVYGARTIECRQGLMFFIIGRLMDGIDGKIARRYHSSSEFGAQLDRHAQKAKLAPCSSKWGSGYMC